jgi:hypothetical protein
MKKPNVPKGCLKAEFAKSKNDSDNHMDIDFAIQLGNCFSKRFLVPSKACKIITLVHDTFVPTESYLYM